MTLPKPEETPKEEPQGKAEGPVSGRTVRVVPARQPAGPPAPAAETPVAPPPIQPPEQTAPPPPVEKTPRAGKGISGGKKLAAIELDARAAERLKIPWKYRLRPDLGLARRAAWDISAVLSLLLNAVLLTVVLLLAAQVKSLKNTVNGLLGGLYDNFVRMDNAVISTTININQMPIPLNFTLPVEQEEVYVTLTRDVTIRNALVGVLSLPTSVTLPRGTVLPVSLRMDVPVKTVVLVDLRVPVNIKLAEANPPDPNAASLHQAFLGLQDTIGPFYCLLEPGARDYTGAYVCREGAYVPKSIR